MNNYCAFSKDHHCIKWQDYVLARLELEECDELCHGFWKKTALYYQTIIMTYDLFSCIYN